MGERGGLEAAEVAEPGGREWRSRDLAVLLGGGFSFVGSCSSFAFGGLGEKELLGHSHYDAHIVRG